MPNNLHHLENELSGPKQKAVEDARKAQAAIVRECIDAGTEPPPYLLSELIGKGSFGRVYRAADTRAKPSRAVAVKIISIEEGDTFCPGAADTFNDILKEVNTLKLLGSSGAKNINIVVDSLLVGQSVWIVTEYCAGGSVASLMRPTGGLPEKWIIPILREVAVAVFWVHRQGIIHRDIKCANVLVTDAGGIQLCDFGVAGIIETKFDKRSTVTGTLQWMAPELFDTTVSYGMEVDIWAFGSMAYEVATGLPPNATANIDIRQFGSHLKQYCPRLEGDKFSDDLKSLVAYCLVDDPKERPRIEDVQHHKYIANTEEEYPTADLAKLVSAYRLWESQGGSRRSLFAAGGAQGFAKDDDEQDEDDGWAFDDGDDSELVLENLADAQAVYDVYGLNLAPPQPAEPTVKQTRRRRLPPKNMPQLKGPLEKVFDPNTLSNYGDNARAFYGRQPSPPPSRSDLPLRDSSDQSSTVRESLIDLDASLGGGDTLTGFAPEAETIKPGNRASEAVFSDAKRKTQEWTFPSMSTTTTTTATTNDSYDAGDQYDMDTGPPTRVFHPSEAPLGSYRPTPLTTIPEPNRDSTLSLIDLDACHVDIEPSYHPPVDSYQPSLESYPPPLDTYPPPPDPHALSLSPTSFSRPNPNSNRESNVSLIDLDASLADVNTRPSTAGSYPFHPGAGNRASNFSLIDLDASLDITRPTTAGSQNTNSPRSMNNDSTPFDLEFEVERSERSYREPSMFIDGSHHDSATTTTSYREPSMFIDASHHDSITTTTSYREPSMFIDASHHDSITTTTSYREPSMFIDAQGSRLETLSSPPSPPSLNIPTPSSPTDPTPVLNQVQPLPKRTTSLRSPQQSISIHPTHSMHSTPQHSVSFSLSSPTGSTEGIALRALPIIPPLPPLPEAPSANVMQGLGSREEVKDELQGLIASLNEHLLHTVECLGALPVRGPGERGGGRWSGGVGGGDGNGGRR